MNVAWRISFVTNLKPRLHSSVFVNAFEVRGPSGLLGTVVVLETCAIKGEKDGYYITARSLSMEKVHCVDIRC